MSRHPELLIPASSLEVLKTAVIFGADAVYIGGEVFGLRAKAKNFSLYILLIILVSLWRSRSVPASSRTDSPVPCSPAHWLRSASDHLRNH